MIDLFSTLLAVLPHHIKSRFLGQGYAQMVAGLLLVPILTLCWRRLIPWIQWKFDDVLFPTAYINLHDEAADWIMAWIAQDPQAQKQMHHFWLSASDKQVSKKSRNALMRGERDQKIDAKNATWASNRIVGKITPIDGQTIHIKHNGSMLWIRKSRGSHLKVRTIVFQRHALKEFLVAAHDAMHTHGDDTIHIYNPQLSWSGPLPRPSRPWSSVILPGTLKDDLLIDIETFFSEKEVRWYSSRGIPHRRGYLFHGTPGAGKTTLITALASRLHLDIFAINPGQSGIDDARLNKLFRDVPRRSIILIEDIDCIFTQKRQTKRPSQPDPLDVDSDDSEIDQHELEEMRAEQREINMRKKHKTFPPEEGTLKNIRGSDVSLSGLLNAIDGVSSQEGCIIIASTNHIEHLDPALYRPGRFDVKIPFQTAMPEQARSLFLHFFTLEDLLHDAHQDSMMTTVPNGTDKKTPDPSNPFSVPRLPSIKVSSKAELDDLADRFVDSLFPTKQGRDQLLDTPEKEKQSLKLSMAALQGYLLRYKDDPTQAAEHAADWANSESVEEWQKRASSLVTIHEESASPSGKKSKKKAKKGETVDHSSKEKVVERVKAVKSKANGANGANGVNGVHGVNVTNRSNGANGESGVEGSTDVAVNGNT